MKFIQLSWKNSLFLLNENNQVLKLDLIQSIWSAVKLLWLQKFAERENGNGGKWKPKFGLKIVNFERHFRIHQLNRFLSIWKKISLHFYGIFMVARLDFEFFLPIRKYAKIVKFNRLLNNILKNCFFIIILDIFLLLS